MPKKKRGLANVPPEVRLRVAKAGGAAVARKHQSDTYYHDIGSIGGQNTAEKMIETNFYQEIGRRGGIARQKKGLAKKVP